MRISDAVFSECGKYRYRLTRGYDWDPNPLTIVMLNPSTADAEKDDPTIRRCETFARKMGSQSIIVVNLFALRSTSPKGLYAPGIDPIGPDNDKWVSEALQDAARRHSLVLAAWGVHGNYRDRGHRVRSMNPSVKWICLGSNANGTPKHPLFLRRDTGWEPF